ncbi:MAG: hypothetical protein ACRDTE_17060, partial [Pseudonocardiaceae bacterium]
MPHDDRIELTDLAREHLVAGSAFDTRAYFGSLAERPTAIELAHVLRTGSPAAWASARSSTEHHDGDWSGRLGDVEFAHRITAAMDARVAGRSRQSRRRRQARPAPSRGIFDTADALDTRQVLVDRGNR